MRSKYIIQIILVISTLLLNCKLVNADTKFIKAYDGIFKYPNGNNCYFIGANFWYGTILASQGEGGDRDRLHRELDQMQKMGINNLRILIGSDGANGVVSKVEPTLQLAPGVYNDEILDGLDYLMVELGKRKMYAVLYLNNSWEWSGGYSQYLQWAGHGKSPIPAIDGWGAYMKYVQQFHKSDSSKVLFSNYVRDIVSRTNRYTKLKYCDDPAIFSWQIGNEPRAFGDDNKQNFALWIKDIAALIKSIDPNHMVSIGSEGKAGCEGDIELWRKIHEYSNIDYATIHVWAYNWGWIDKTDIPASLPTIKLNVKKYIDEHLYVAKHFNKPVVLEEFGFPRDSISFSRTSKTVCRDTYYGYIFNIITQHYKERGLLAGCNFWAWGGEAMLSQKHLFWQKGDPYCGDPAQEEQGLNSIFSTDSTVKIIKKSNRILNQQNRQ